MKEVGYGALIGSVVCLAIHFATGYAGFGFVGVFALGAGLICLGLGGDRNAR